MAQRVRVGSGEIAYERTGVAGDPVVLVHGGWDDRSTWDRAVGGLAVAFQVLSYDRRGHGDSPGRPAAGAVRADAADLAELLEATGLHPAHLLAQGYGAAPALTLALERPELVRGIALHEPPFFGLAPEIVTAEAEAPGGETLGARWRRTIGLAASGRSENAAAEFLELVGAPTERWGRRAPDDRARFSRAAATWGREMSDPEASDPPRSLLRGIPVPVLVSSGGDSPEPTRAVNDRLVIELPNATSVRLHEGGHFVQRTDPDLWVGVVGGFLLERNVPPT